MKIPTCHIELGDSGKGQWWWRMDVCNPNVSISGDYAVYQSAKLAKLGAEVVARRFGIRVDSTGICGKEYDD